MSSATSIERGRSVPLPVDPQTSRSDGPDVDATFRPWHFFVLASLVAATVAVRPVAPRDARASRVHQPRHRRRRRRRGGVLSHAGAADGAGR